MFYDQLRFVYHLKRMDETVFRYRVFLDVALRPEVGGS